MLGPLTEHRHLGAMNVEVSKYLCERPSSVRWKRTHRRARIRKKWRKRYGKLTVVGKCSGRAFQVGDQLVVCPCVWAELDKLKDVSH